MWALVENELRAIESPTCDAPRRLCEVCKEALSPCSDWVSVGSKSFHRYFHYCVLLVSMAAIKNFKATLHMRLLQAQPH
jgi:hypothetical protein